MQGRGFVQKKCYHLWQLLEFILHLRQALNVNCSNNTLHF